jgi:hypothetical protein
MWLLEALGGFREYEKSGGSLFSVEELSMNGEEGTRIQLELVPSSWNLVVECSVLFDNFMNVVIDGSSPSVVQLEPERDVDIGKWHQRETEEHRSKS